MSGEYAAIARLVTFRPLEQPVKCGNARSQFSASWSATVSLLLRELRAVGARGTVLEIDMAERDFRLDGMLRADRSARSPAVVLSFEATRVAGKPQLRYEVGTYRDWRDNVRAIALALEALRAVDRYGVTKRGEQYAGWRALTAGAGDGDAARGRELIRRAGGDAKLALKRAHPDHGGAEADFRDIQAARDAAREAA